MSNHTALKDATAEALETMSRLWVTDATGTSWPVWRSHYDGYPSAS